MFTVRIWDLPTRLFHWALALCVIGLLITGNMGGDAMLWHFRLGYAVLSLVLFRLVWGLVGGHWSRWAQLSLQPALVWAYLKGRPPSASVAGHNPMGSWAIVAMLSFLIFQVATGLVSDDEIAYSGPLTAMVPGQWVSWATSWHTHWGKLTILFLVALHVLALVWYRFAKRISLVPAMVHGDKQLAALAVSSHDRWSTRLIALLILVMASCGVYALVGWGS